MASIAPLARFGLKRAMVKANKPALAYQYNCAVVILRFGRSCVESESGNPKLPIRIIGVACLDSYEWTTAWSASGVAVQ